MRLTVRQTGAQHACLLPAGWRPNKRSKTT